MNKRVIRLLSLILTLVMFVSLGTPADRKAASRAPSGPVLSGEPRSAG